MTNTFVDGYLSNMLPHTVTALYLNKVRPLKNDITYKYFAAAKAKFKVHVIQNVIWVSNHSVNTRKCLKKHGVC